MKSKFQLFCIALLVACPGVLLAQGSGGDPINAQLFSPEELMKHRAEIGLSDQQLEQIRGLIEQTGPIVQQHQAGLREATSKLAQLLAAEKVDEEAALKQLDKLLGIEKEVKHAHLRVMIQIRNQLTAEQRKIAAKLKQSPQHDKGLEQRLKLKIARIEREVQRRANAGHPPFDAVELMQKLPPLMQQGKVKEAEALLDRVLKTLGVDGDDKPNKKPNPRNSQSSRPKPKRDAKSLLSPNTVRAEVTAMKKQDVAWRKIEWKTCLLDGLKASREQKKPIMLWIFIDRPIGDERC